MRDRASSFKAEWPPIQTGVKSRKRVVTENADFEHHYLAAVATKPIADVSLASPVRRTSRQAFGLPARLWPMSALRLLHPEAAGAARLPICFDDRAFSRCLRHGRAPRTSAQDTAPSRQAPRRDREKARAAAANRQLIGLHMTGSTPPCSGRRRKGCE